MNQASKAFCILLVWYLKKIDWVIILVIWDIYYYYSYSLEPKEPNQHVGTMRRRPHQYTSACIWLWCTFVVFWLARYIFWYLACTVWPNPRRLRRRRTRRTVALPPPSPHTPERAARTAAYFVAAAYCATAVGGGAATAAACAVKKGVYLRQAKSADVVCM